MRLSVSLTLWLAALIALVLGLHGWLQLSEEEEDLHGAVTRELIMVATAVRSTVENAVRDAQEGDIGVLLEQLELKDPAIDVFVFGAGADLLGSSWGSMGNLASARALALGSRDHKSMQISYMDGGEIAAIAPFRASGQVMGHVVILRPLNTVRADLREERNAVLLSIVLLVAVVSAGIWVILSVRLQRPVSQMVATVNRVAAGDLTARVGREGADELSVLARELDMMVESLERARLQLAREAETREKLEGEMLRANRLAIVGELAATLAHEVGSPLQVLGGRARDIVDRKDIPDAVARHAGIIMEQVDRVHEIVERFLDVARRKAPAASEVDLSNAVSQVVELLAGQGRRKGVRFEVQTPQACVVRADPAQLQQVLLNLLQNALRASQPDDTVWVKVAPSAFKRTSDGTSLPSMALSVEDRGPGIPQGTEHLVFQPFFTAWSGGPEQPAGTGLGLSVVRTIMNDHGGLVQVEPGPEGRGARFVAHFPLTAEPVVEQSVVAEPVVAEPTATAILVAESSAATEEAEG